MVVAAEFAGFLDHFYDLPDALRWPGSAVLTQQQTPVEVWLSP